MASNLNRVLGVIFAVIAIIGTVFLGWEWGGPIQPIPFVLAVLAVIIGTILFINNYILS